MSNDADWEGWWCCECNGLGGWEVADPDFDGVVESCPCCSGEGQHPGEDPPRCHPRARAKRDPPGAARKPT